MLRRDSVVRRALVPYDRCAGLAGCAGLELAQRRFLPIPFRSSNVSSLQYKKEDVGFGNRGRRDEASRTISKTNVLKANTLCFVEKKTLKQLKGCIRDVANTGSQVMHRALPTDRGLLCIFFSVLLCVTMHWTKAA